MIKKLVMWVKSLLAPAKIEDFKVDEYIAHQARQGKLAGYPRQGVEELVAKKVPATPPKSLNQQLKGVELPSYAKGKTLPPKAKRQYIKQARASSAPKMSGSPPSFGYNSQANHTAGIDPMNAAIGGYMAATIMQQDVPEVTGKIGVEECRHGSENHPGVSDHHSPMVTSGYESSSTGGSYDSGSYDSGSSYSSCD